MPEQKTPSDPLVTRRAAKAPPKGGSKLEETVSFLQCFSSRKGCSDGRK